MDIFGILSFQTIPNSNVTPDFKKWVRKLFPSFFVCEEIKLLMDGKHHFYTKSQNHIYFTQYKHFQ